MGLLVGGDHRRCTNSEGDDHESENQELSCHSSYVLSHPEISPNLKVAAMLSQSNDSAPSVAFFCPQSKAPTEAYLTQLQKYLTQNSRLQPLLEAIISLKDTWATLCNEYADIAKVTTGPQHVLNLERWVTEGISGPVSKSMSGILSLPLLVVIHICQYFQWLEIHNLTHAEVLQSLKSGGGAQGYCGGLPTAFAIACAEDEENVVRLAGKALRLALAMGAFGQLGDDESVPGVTTIAVRLKSSQQGSELIRDVPEVSHFSSVPA